MRSSPTRPGQDVPFCLPPLDRVEAASFEIPPGACDTHAHVVAADAQAYPMVAGRSTPHPATEQSYLSMLDAQGMARGVLVQISVYGTDNRYMLEVLRRHPDRLRGIGVVAPTVTDAELEPCTPPACAVCASTCCSAAASVSTRWRPWRGASPAWAGTCSS